MPTPPVPASVPRPGELLEREIAARGWTQKDLAIILGRPVSTINEIARGVKQITPETAMQLEEVFDISAQMWLNLESKYRLWLAQRQQAVLPDVRRRTELYQRAPIADMLKRGWLVASASLDDLEKQVDAFLSIKVVPVSCRSGKPDDMEESALKVWQRRVIQVVRQRSLPKFDRQILEDAMTKMLDFTRRVADVARVPKLLEGAGVHFVIVGHLPHTYLDGATFFVEEHPVVALTLRYDRIDSFWFTLFHELFHILRDHKGTHFVYTENIHADAQEDQADKDARNALVPAREYQYFVTTARPFFSKAHVERFANLIHRHPGIVVGRLQFDKHVDYKNMRALLVSVKEHLLPWTDDVIMAQA